MIDRYHYTSLEAFNEVLRPYNIKEIQLQLRQNGQTGLIYVMINPEGRIQGKSIWSGTISFKPTLKKLEKRFTENEKKRIPHRESLMTRIRWASWEGPGNMRGLTRRLEEERSPPKRMAIKE